MAVKALQLPLHGAADAAAVAAVQPVAHHTQAVVPLLPVKRKVLYFGGNALAALGPRSWGPAAVLFSGGDKGSQPEDPPRVNGGEGGWIWGSRAWQMKGPGTEESPPCTHRGIWTPSGETGEAECGTPRKLLAESGGDSNTSSCMELISSWSGGAPETG